MIVKKWIHNINTISSLDSNYQRIEQYNAIQGVAQRLNVAQFDKREGDWILPLDRKEINIVKKCTHV